MMDFLIFESVPVRVHLSFQGKVLTALEVVCGDFGITIEGDKVRVKLGAMLGVEVVDGVLAEKLLDLLLDAVEDALLWSAVVITQ